MTDWPEAVDELTGVFGYDAAGSFYPLLENKYVKAAINALEAEVTRLQSGIAVEREWRERAEAEVERLRWMLDELARQWGFSDQQMADLAARCGRRWSDGEWMPLEFYRNARRDSINDAKKTWRRNRERAKEASHE